MATRPVEGTPLSVVVSAPDTTTGQWTPHHRYYGFAFSASLLVLMAAWHAAKRERQHKRQISDLAHNDPLTHLPNRRSFETRLDRLIDDPDAEPFLLHLIDIDHFKTINDTFGHPTGDQLLCAVAERLNSAVRSTDLVFRLGGDEFALVQSGDVTRDAAETVGARICRMMAEPFEIGSHRLHIGASVGIAALGTDVADRVSLLKAADVALYLAKSEGRGRFRLYNTEINLALERRRVLEAELEEAILGGQLELHYQPKVVLEAPVRVAGYEALVRWRHPDRGMIPPLEFISLAEDTGLIVELGEWVLTRACRDLMATGLDQTVAVNVSAVQFRKGTVVDAVERALAASGLPAERLEIEITESMLMDNNAVTAEQLKALRARGVKLALDDFGTGYSSLSYLERYPLDTVKIDRSFVAKLGIEARAAAIVRAIVVLAHELGMTPVAEGVETAAQADLLAALGCPMAQGYLFGRPEPAAKLWPSRAAA
jgi:diguanylate cyclase (GGDEF)-like protein